jgi:Tfp pilus assembly protein PilN
MESNMNVDMEHESLSYQLRKERQNNNSGFKWFLIIFLGVFLGNSASIGVERLILYWELNQIAKASTAALNELSRQSALDRKQRELNLAQQRKLQAEREKERQIQLNQKSAAFRQANEMCMFWREQVRSDNTQQNRVYRDQACALVNKFR